MGAFAESDSESRLTTSLFTTKNALVVVGAWLLWHVLKTLYNVSPFHPLSHVPGPKLAAATYLYEFYYDVILFGQFSKQIRTIHEKYGKSREEGIRRKFKSSPYFIYLQPRPDCPHQPG